MGNEATCRVEYDGEEAAAKTLLDVFFATSERSELDRRLTAIRKALVPDGAVWVVRPRGVSTITESDVMAAGKRAGLVDVKVVRFSDSHTAEKLVIPITKR